MSRENVFKAIMAIVAIAFVLVLVAAVITSEADEYSAAQAALIENPGQFTLIGAIDDIKIIKLLDGDHVCYLVTNTERRYVAPAIDCLP